MARQSQTRTRGYGFFLLGLAIWTATFLILYPPTTAIVDEHAYLTQAYLFRSGHLSYDNSPVPVAHQSVDRRESGGHIVSKYAPGTGLWLVPFTIFGWQWVFLSGLLLALTGTVLTAALLNRLHPRTDPAWALLFLCYPTVTLFSRTIMSDLPATVAGLAAFYLLLRRKLWLVSAGAMLGLACTFRYPMIVMALPFAVILLQDRETGAGRRLLLFLLGLVPFGLLILAYNSYAYGGPFKLPLSPDDRFSISYLVRNLLYYGLNLAVWYPLLIIGPLAAGRRHWLRLGLPPLALLLFYSCFSYIHRAPLLERITVGMRYLLPALPYFVLGYAVAAERIVHSVGIPRFLPRIGLALALLSALAVQYRHQQHLQLQAEYRSALYAVLPADALLISDKEVSKMVNVAWGWRDCRYYGGLDPDTLPADRPLYAAFLERPGRVHEAALAAFDSLLEKFPERTLVLYRDRPYRLRLYLLR